MTHTLDKTSSRDEPGPDDIFSPHSPRFSPHVLRLLLFFGGVHLLASSCCRGSDLCYPSAQCARGVRQSPYVMMMWTKPEVGACPSAPIITLVNHVRVDESLKRHPTQRQTPRQHSLSDCLRFWQKHFFHSPRKLEDMVNSTYFVPRFQKSSRKSLWWSIKESEDAKK